MVGKVSHLFVTFGNDRDDLSASGFDLLDIGHNFVVMAFLHSDHKNRHIFVYKGDRAVFHFCSRITFCVNVGNLFQFQSAFESSREIVSAAEIKRIVCIFINCCDPFRLLICLKYLLYFCRQRIQFVTKTGESFVGKISIVLT